MRRSIRVVLVGATLAVAVTVISPLAKADSDKLTLHPNGFGQKSYAAWKAKQGLTDTRGDANQALYFQKMTTTGTFAAGVAVIKGIEGTPASALTGLSWSHRDDGHCGAGAPRWNIGLETSTGMRHTVFLGCAAAAHAPETALDPNDPTRTWTRDTFPVPVAAPGETIVSLAIVFDEGNDAGEGYVFLDNITVEVNDVPHVWTSPADNGNQ